MGHRTSQQIVTVIEGLIALFLGSADRIVWITQADAASFCDGHKIYLPKPTGEHVQEYDLLLGIALREVAKILHSETPAMASAASEVAPYAAAMEEVRIKAKLSDAYPGARAMFESALTAVADITANQAADQGSSDAALLRLIWASAHDGWLYSDQSHMAMTRFQKMLSESERSENLGGAVDLAKRACLTATTNEAIDLGTRVKQALGQSDTASDDSTDESSPEDSTEKEASADSSSESQTSEAQDDGSTQTDGAAPVDVLSDALARLKGFDGAADVASQAAEIAAQATPSEALPTDSFLRSAEAAMQQPGNASEALMVLIDESSEDAEEATGQLDGLGGVLGGDELASQSDPSNNMLTGVQAKLVTVLLREFQDKRRRTFMRGVAGPQVAATHLWRLKRMGDVRVFRPKQLSSGIDAAVSILLDRSDSMEYTMTQACDVTYALALAMQRLSGVQVSVDVFPGEVSASREILGFKQNLRSVKEKFERLTANGGTPTGDAILNRLPKLLAARTQKKMLLVVTDGRPNSQDTTQRAISLAIASGIDVIGIGIGIDVSRMFVNNIMVDSINDLAGALEALFKSDMVEKLAA